MNLKLRKYREANSLTQQDLAKVIGKSFRTIQSWERGDSFPNAEALWDLCVYFDTDPDDFLGWWDEHPREGIGSALTRDESMLLDGYRELTPGRRESVRDTVDALAAKSKESESGSGVSTEDCTVGAA